MTFSAGYGAGRLRYSNVAGCNCDLRGYVATTLHGYRRVTLGGLGSTALPRGTPALIPVSDRSAVEAAVKLFAGGRRARQLRGLGTSEHSAKQAQGAASMAASGAKIGSIIPGVGTVIGAVVGAIAGFLMAGKKKPVRASAEQVAQCRNMLSEYMSMAGQSPNEPIPMDRQMLLDMNWCFSAIHGATVGLRDPRWFNPGFEQAVLMLAKTVVKKIYDTPVGGTVELASLAIKDPKGRTLTFKGSSFTNAPFTDLKSFTHQHWLPVLVKYCQDTAGKGAGGCPAYYGTPEFQRLAYDTIAWAAREVLPNISEADLREASKVAASTGTSASEIVKAVEQVIGRSVTKNQTAELLNPGSSTAPPPAPVLTPGAPAQAPPSHAPSLTMPSIPGALPLPSFAPSSFSPTSFAPGAEYGGITPGTNGSGIAAQDRTGWYIGGAALIGALFFFRRR